MKNLKSLLSVLCLALGLTFTVQAETIAPKDGEPTSITKQLKSYLSGLNLQTLEEDKSLLVDFILNARNEILVISTNSKELDKSIKAKLNYKVVSDHELNINVVYTLPITFKAE